jgi:uncharacterized membrane protein
MNQSTAINSEENSSARTLTMIVYGLQAASFITGVSIFAAIIINYIKMDDVKGTAYESHFRWQIRTFWFSALWAVISIPFCFVLVGYFFLLANTIWFLYRIIKGFVNLIDGKSMYKEEFY